LPQGRDKKKEVKKSRDSERGGNPKKNLESRAWEVGWIRSKPIAKARRCSREGKTRLGKIPEKVLGKRLFQGKVVGKGKKTFPQTSIFGGKLYAEGRILVK